MQEKKYSECLQAVLIKYNNRAIETAQMTEASEGFQPVMVRDDAPALNTDKITFYEALQKTKASFGRRGKVTAEVSLKLSLTTNQSVFKVELMDLIRYLWMCFVYG
ncbi:hypothetical protein EIZ30_21360 [Escherichia coli]|nr:hypothetical protein [Escherichia coli]EFC4830664.1 DUF3387 domain-containing protein [Escherichia coli]EFC6933183.1 DUF3387 domain-containing protein [Escherichia coli]EFE3813589.1 DUF3387 domain-containing protein [Escherichia coli]EHY1708309.1 hypothetical protein [Escherichia coli]